MSLGCVWYKTRPGSSRQNRVFLSQGEGGREGGERTCSEPVHSWETEVSGWESGPQVLGGKDSAEQGLLLCCA